LDELDHLVGPRVKALILNTPHNPTGAVYSEEIIREIFSMCEKHDVIIISDEVYSRQVSPGKTFFSPSTIDFCKERVFVVHSLSKTFGLTGWRIGVLTGPDSLMPSIQLAAEAMLSCVPPFIQVAAAVALQRMNDSANNWVDKIEVRKKRFYQDLDALEALDLQQSDGTFYCFGRLVAPSLSAIDVANQLLESSHVAVVPGDHFGTLGEGYLRFALTTSDQDCLIGAQRISRFFDSKLS
jgi:aminotransferase